MAAPLAHSPPHAGAAPQPYSEHIGAVAFGARARAEAAAQFARDRQVAQALVEATTDAGTFHDLGKLDPDDQKVFARFGAERLAWDHIDAGVAHLMRAGACAAAWLVRGHHAPGLPSRPLHFSRAGRNADQVRRLRGRRSDDAAIERHAEQQQRTDRLLPSLLDQHHAVVGNRTPVLGRPAHGVPLRLALSCLVDADHTDTAQFSDGHVPPIPPAPRWPERLAALDAHVAELAAQVGARTADRVAFYQACRHGPVDAALVSCQGAVGIGKTTAVLAWLLRRAIATGARRVFVVAPFTAILSQSADRLRKALVLGGEDAYAVVAEHHHRADFEDRNARDLAVLWSAPVVLTTAVQFFETLAANAPAQLRKLHALPGSCVFIDEAHAAIPTPLWPQNWRWLRELADDWSCSFVLASGSLARFWELPDVVGDATQLPELVPPDLTARLDQAERRRVVYRSLGRLAGPDGIAANVCGQPGPRLLILNTVQSAAVMARHLRQTGHDVLHLSTALCPADRAAALARVMARLRQPDDDSWTLVATSLVEAGVDISFRTAFRERFSTASLIQTGGRANRHGERMHAATVFDFIFDTGPNDRLKHHPAAKLPASVLEKFFARHLLDSEAVPADLITNAMRLELRAIGFDAVTNRLVTAETARDYPEVAQLGRVIDADTRLVVVDPALRARLEARAPVGAHALLSGSVQIWANKIADLALTPIPGRADVFDWPYAYDPDFLGYMQGLLDLLTPESCIL